MLDALKIAWKERGTDGLKRDVYRLFHSNIHEDRAQHFVRVTIAATICLSLLVVILASEQSIERSYGGWLDAIEATVIVLFSVEYFLRVWSITIEEGYTHAWKGRLRYAITGMALIDLVAILPFFLPHIIPVNLTFVRVLRLIVLLRVVKLGRYSQSIHLIGRVFKSKQHELAASFGIVLLLLLSASIMMYYIESPGTNNEFSSIPKTVWWSIATVTTVDGYAHNVFPSSDAGKAVSVIISLLAFVAVGLPAGIFTTGLLDEYQNQRKASDECPHCGGNLITPFNEEESV